MARKKKAPPTAWEIAKPLLEKDYLDGKATDDMPPSVVVAMRVEYENVPYRNFCPNWLALKKRIKSNKQRAVDDEDALTHDLAFYRLSKDTPGCWESSEAKVSLLEDIEKGRHLLQKPKELRQTRVEYKAFELKEFRDHIYQETRRRLETNYWLVKKRKKEFDDEDGNDDEDRDDEEDFLSRHMASTRL